MTETVSAGDVLLDVSELALLPLRAGIQRATRELMRFWPGPGRLRPCIYDHSLGGLRFLPEASRALLMAGAAGSELTVGEERDALHAMLAAEAVRPVPPGAGPILNVELFIDSGRAEFYERQVRNGRRDVFWLLHDFFPWLQPEWFPQFAGRACMPYLHAAVRMPHVAFNSQATRLDWLNRITRSAGNGRPEGRPEGRPDGPVIALGGDGMGLERQRFHPARAGYATLGTLEPRKRFAAVLDAFNGMWARGSGARLTVIGRLLPSAVREAELIAALAGEPRFTFLPNASDVAVRDALRSCRALLFPSASEGFGLPPFEALHCGIPVLAAPGVPSLDMLPPAGRITLADPLPDSIADAVTRLEDDAVAARLWDAAAGQRVPGWRDFAGATAAWVLAGSAGG